MTDGAAQTLEWRSLQDLAIARDRVEKGVVLTFPPDLAERVADLAAREAACCSFLEISVSQVGGSIQLRISSSQPDAGPVIELLAGPVR